MSVDPHKELKGICQSEMLDLEKLYAAWDDALRNTDTQADGGAAYRKRAKRLRAKTDKCVRMVGDLNLSVRAVGRARAQFPHIDDTEFGARQAFTERHQRRLREVQEAVKSQRVKDKLAADKRKVLVGRGGEVGGGVGPAEGGSSGGSSNSDFLQRNRTQQKEIRGEQDEILDDMSAGVERLDVMSKAMLDELDEEKRLLAQYTLEMEEAQARMNVVLRGMSKLLKTKNTCFLWLILFLTVTIVVESILLFWVD